jgi:hypothetical protein
VGSEIRRGQRGRIGEAPARFEELTASLIPRAETLAAGGQRGVGVGGISHRARDRERAGGGPRGWAPGGRSLDRADPGDLRPARKRDRRRRLGERSRRLVVDHVKQQAEPAERVRGHEVGDGPTVAVARDVELAGRPKRGVPGAKVDRAADPVDDDRRVGARSFRDLDAVEHVRRQERRDVVAVASVRDRVAVDQRRLLIVERPAQIRRGLRPRGSRVRRAGVGGDRSRRLVEQRVQLDRALVFDAPAADRAHRTRARVERNARVCNGRPADRRERRGGEADRHAAARAAHDELGGGETGVGRPKARLVRPAGEREAPFRVRRDGALAAADLGTRDGFPLGGDDRPGDCRRQALSASQEGNEEGRRAESGSRKSAGLHIPPLVALVRPLVPLRGRRAFTGCRRRADGRPGRR